MDNGPNASPSLETGSISSTELQTAVDNIGLEKIEGRLQSEDGAGVTVLGVDIIPGVVLRRAEGNYEAPGVVYLESRNASARSSQSRRATIVFHVGDAGIEIDSVALAS
jgi:hypothetical protein